MKNRPSLKNMPSQRVKLLLGTISNRDAHRILLEPTLNINRCVDANGRERRGLVVPPNKMILRALAIHEAKFIDKRPMKY